MDKYNATEIINALTMLENATAQRGYSSTDATIDQIFYNAFGLDWDRIEFFRELRKHILNLMELKEDIVVKGYYYLLSI